MVPSLPQGVQLVKEQVSTTKPHPFCWFDQLAQFFTVGASAALATPHLYRTFTLFSPRELALNAFISTYSLVCNQELFTY
jgi:hypothetical protein